MLSPCSSPEVFITVSYLSASCLNQHIVMANTLTVFSSKAVYSTWAIPKKDS